MIVAIPPRLKSFCGRFAPDLTEKRREEMARTPSPVRRREFARIRTRGLKGRLAREAHAADAEWIAELARSREGRSHAHELLPALKKRA